MILRMKKSISSFMVIALALFLFVFCAPAASAATAETGTVSIQGANLREQPSTASTILTKMDKGAEVSVLDSESGGWYKIKYQDMTGYARTDYINVMVTGLKDPAVMLRDAAMTAQPDPASGVVQTIPLRTQVTVTGTYGSMYQISDGSNSGYVPKNSVHKYTIMTISLKAKVSASTANLRSAPSTSGDILTEMKRGAAVTAYSIQDNWVKIECAGKEGYVRGDLITYTIPSGMYLTDLSPGMKCQAVTNLQIALKKKGFFNVAANGVYGSATKAAVAKFQSFVYLKSDGVAGVQTLMLLLGPRGAAELWYNYRSSLPAQKPQKNGNVWLQDWEGGMEKVVKRYTPFEVIDVRTGIHWNMQRFGGWDHADVETMTKSDTANMTKAWGGELDPSRRPVWVKIGGKYYAASLMGFVHNTDTISTNGMDGQICLHFRGSKIHESGHIDEAHQACIVEAFTKAARLDAYIKAGKV
ncbi:MAG: SH3 domain-containing protein [Christensenellales bacterium]